MAKLNAPAANYFSLQSIDGGVVYGRLPYKLAANQSPDMCNMLLDEQLLCKRRGVENVLDGGTGSIDAVYADFGGACWYASGTSLYAYDYATQQTDEKYSALHGAGKGTFFVYGAKLYYKCAGDFIAISPDGTAAPVEGYVPLVLVSCDPTTGSGTENEQLNRISAGARIRYTATGTVSTLKLPKALLPLDATAVTVDVSGAAKVETTDFTVNRTTGVITVVGTAWPAGINHITVTAYHTAADSETSILGCSIAIPYGGDATGLEGGTRIFLAGNADAPNTIYYSGLLDPTYWPENGFILIGQSDAAVTAFGKQYDLLYVFTGRSLHSVEYTFDGSTARFVTKEVSSAVGCDMPNTVQLIQNRLVWCSTAAGVCVLTSTNIRDERNVMPLSANINARLLGAGAALRDASSADYDNKYWLCVGDAVYVWDYGATPYYFTGSAEGDQSRLAWFPLLGIAAARFWEHDQALYFARRGAEAIDRMSGTSAERSAGKLVDYGTAPIAAYWRSADWAFSAPNLRKTIEKLWFTVRTYYYSEYDIRYFSDRAEKDEGRRFAVASFNWERVGWATWTWQVLRIAYTLRAKAKMKKCVYFGVLLQNSKAHQDLTVSDLVIEWSADGEAK